MRQHQANSSLLGGRRPNRRKAQSWDLLVTKDNMGDIIEAQRVEKAYNKLKTLLTQREKDVITRYYGIDKHVRHTLHEIGTLYKVTRERIRQIKAEALRKIKIKK